MKTMQRRTVAVCLAAVLVAGLFALVATGGMSKRSKSSQRASASATSVSAAFDPVASAPYKPSSQHEARALAASKKEVRLKTPGAPGNATAAGGWIWVSGHRGGDLLKIDPTTNKVVRNYNLKQSICGITPIGPVLIVPNCGPGGTIFNIASGRFRFFLHIPAAYAAGSLWYPNPDTGIVQRVDPKTHVVVKRFRGVDVASQATVSAGSLWIPGEATLSRIDMRDDTLTIIPLPGAKKEGTAYQGYATVGRIASTPGAVWIGNPAGIYRVDERTNRATLLPGIRVGKLDEYGPIDVVGAGDSIVVRLSATEVARIDAATGKVVARYKAPRLGGGGGIEVADGSVWITNFGDNTTWRVPLGSTQGA